MCLHTGVGSGHDRRRHDCRFKSTAKKLGRIIYERAVVFDPGSSSIRDYIKQMYRGTPARGRLA